MTDLVYIADFTESDRDILLEYLWIFSTQIDNKYEVFNIQIAKQQIIIDEGLSIIYVGELFKYIYIYIV